MNSSLFLKKATIPFFVFITGACVLIIEITATRILAPYFGNTLFSISSVISVVLAALSFGYYVGGRWADKSASEETFFKIIAAGGLGIIILHLIGVVFLNMFGYNLPITTGPLIASLILFFGQNFLLGMLSPFAVKLQAMRVQDLGVGSASGSIFFWSTLGSIFGSLVSGFWLIPNFGINQIMLCIGCLLIILGISAVVKMELRLKVLLTLICLLASFWWVHSISYKLSSFLQIPSVVYSADALYQRVVIYDKTYMGQPARFLLQDRNSSAVEFTNSSELAAEYTKYYVLYQLLKPNITEALMIGGGAYSVPKDLLAKSPNTHIDVAEIEPTLFNLGKTYFNVPTNSNLNNVAEDGRRLLVDSHKKYDLIFSDAYSSVYSTPEHLTTQEFFTLAKSRLSDNGAFVANVVGGLSAQKGAFVFSEMKTFKSIFPNSYFFAVNSPNHEGLQNLIFVGYNSTNAINLASKEIKGSKNPILAGLAQKQIDISNIDFSQYPLLTDDFAPVEYLIAKQL